MAAWGFEPLRRNASFFIFMYLLGLFCQWLEVPETKGAHIYPLTWIELFFDLYLLCVVLSLLPLKARRVARGILYVVFYGLALTDVFCWVKYKSPINPSMVMLLSETNSREAGEMLSTMLSADVLASGVGRILLLMLVHVLTALLPCLKKRLGDDRYTRWLLYEGHLQSWTGKAAPYAGLLCAGLFVWGAFQVWPNKQGIHRLMTARNIGEAEHLLTRPDRGELYEPIYRAAFSLYANSLTAKQLARMMETLDKAKVDSCTFLSPTIVLIIGESYNKHHSSLYGYNMPTAPRQKAREQTGRLVRFTDVVAPWNLTSFVFKEVFSTWVTGQQGEWCDQPLFPELFRKAGYHVSFLTNQFLPKAREAVYDFSGGFFLNDPRLSAAQFDTRNDRLHVLDSGLLSDYDSLKRDNTGHDLIIFHLMGQHVSYRTRFNARQRKFFADDYKESRPDLNKRKRIMLSYYDNAVLYNDSVVDQIVRRFDNQDAVVIYMPDHGEECYEPGRDVVCRLHSAAIDYPLAHHEFEIPFWIYCTHEYAERHPEVYRQIVQAKDRKWMTDALPHLLLYLAGISTPSYQEENNVLSSEYRENRPRLLKGTTDYDQLKPHQDE